MTWTQGYLSGINEVKDKQAKNLRTDPNAILAYLLKHCHDKPLDEVYVVVNALMVDLSAKNRPIGDDKWQLQVDHRKSSTPKSGW